MNPSILLDEDKKMLGATIKKNDDRLQNVQEMDELVALREKVINLKIVL